VLHLDGERIQKNRIDADALRVALDKWHVANERAEEHAEGKE
jgi:hypothetical protein